MLKFKYETDRMYLRILDEGAYKEVLEFYQNNLGSFEVSEPIDPESFSEEYFRDILRYEHQMILKSELIRYWAIPKAEPGRICGTVSFRDINRGNFQCCTLGYKVDKDYRGMGYATEMVSFGVELMEKEVKLHRIEATVLPDNEPSIRLLEKLNFKREGYLREKIQLQGVWRDHYFYARINESNE